MTQPVEPAPVPGTDRRKPRWARLGKTLLWFLLSASIGLGILSAALASNWVRGFARRQIEGVVRSSLQGELDIGRLDRLSLIGFTATNVRWTDPSGREVLSARIVRGRINLLQLLASTLDLNSLDIQGLRLGLFGTTEHPSVPSLVDAFAPRSTGEGGSNFRVRLSNVRVRSGTALLDLSGLPIRRIAQLTGQLSIDTSPEFTLTGRDIRFDVEEPRGEHPLHAAFTSVRFQVGDSLSLEGQLARPDMAPLTARGGIDFSESEPLFRVLLESQRLPLGIGADLGFMPQGIVYGFAHTRAQVTGPIDAPTVALQLVAPPVADQPRSELNVTLSPDDLGWLVQMDARDYRVSDHIAHLPLLTTTATGRINLTQNRIAWTASIDAAAAFGFEVHEIDVTGNCIKGEVVLEQIRSRDDQSLSGSAILGANGAVALRLSLDNFLLGPGGFNVPEVRGFRGQLSGTVDVGRLPNEEVLAFKTALHSPRVAWAGLSADGLNVRGNARLDGDELSYSVRASGAHLRGAGPIDHFDIVAVGDQSHANLDASATLSGLPHRLHTVARLELATPRTTLTVHSLELISAVDGTRMATRGGAQLSIEGNAMNMSALLLQGPRGSAVSLSRLSIEDNAIALRASVSAINIPSWMPILSGEQAITGIYTGSVEANGSLASPRLQLDGALTDAQVSGFRNASLSHQISHRDGRWTVAVAAELGDRGRVVSNGYIRLPFRRLSEPVNFATFEAFRIDVEQVNLAFLRPWLPNTTESERASVLHTLDGKLSFSALLDGPLTSPDITGGALVLDRFMFEGSSRFRIKSRFDVQNSALTLHHLWIADPQGELIYAEGNLNNLWTRSQNGDLLSSPYSLNVRLAPRSLAEWPAPLNALVPPQLRAAAILSLSFDGSEHHGFVSADVSSDSIAWLTPENFRCASAHEPNAHVELTLDEDSWQAQGSLRTSNQTRARLLATGATFWDSLIGDPLSIFADWQINLRTDQAQLHELPFFCGVAQGQVLAGVDIRGSREQGDSSISLSIEELSFPEQDPRGGVSSAPVDVELTAQVATNGQVTLCLLSRDSASPMRTELGRCDTASLPEEGETRFRLTTDLNDVLGTAHVSLDLVSSPLGPWLAWLPGIAESQVLASGQLTARLEDGSPNVQGGLTLSDGTLRIIGTGHRLTHLRGPIRFSGTQLAVDGARPLQLNDDVGEVTLWGTFEFDDPSFISADLAARVSRFPARRDGFVMANLNGDLGVQLEVRPTGLVARVDTHGMSVSIPESVSTTVQPLSTHPEVIVIAESVTEVAGSFRYPYRISVNLSDPVEITGNGFNAVATGRFEADYRDPDFSLLGQANVRSGGIEILGKRFRLEQSSISFDREVPMDPLIDLVAVHTLSAGGGTVTLLVSGRLSSPVIRFRTEESDDTGEALAALLGASRRRVDQATREQATSQASEFVAGLSVGVLTLGLREQFGAVIPNVAIESVGDDARRYRFSWDANWIIPDFLRDAVLGAYVEGFVTHTGRSQGGSTGGLGAGVTIELDFPLGFGSSATFVPPSSGSVDLLWDPR